ncbi:Mob1/phocein [Suillus subalutaceus]|uniref:Mob1/phocein n=1 Tax=Suillus subalutaceus TaxID=48586 RepID=UPI001B861959|nr:Mob1/phocein [Suillus subalutaceus]KAG1867286.1 Mob1/phocein [Suillus subalutaceus]
MAVAVLRPLRGSRVSSFYPVKTLPSLSSLDSAFQLQEYISLLIRLDVHDVNSIVSLPGKAAFKDAEEKSSDLPDLSERKPDNPERKSDVTVDRGCWIYEQLRRLAQDLSHPLITMLQQECTRNTCPEMKAGEWLYLCVAHGNDGAMEQCCAIDYILHTLDSATALLNSPRAFPSRYVMITSYRIFLDIPAFELNQSYVLFAIISLSIPPTSYRHFSSLARRLGRIFAHAYFHHREAFEQAEAESSLYARFLKLTSQFDLVPTEFLVIPSGAVLSGRKGRDEDVEPPRLLAAAVNPPREREDQNAPTAEQAQPPNVREKSPPGLSSDSPIGTDSPRRLGRNRTDTMVFSEGYNVAEELAKGGDHGVTESDALLHTALSAEPESYSQASWSSQPSEFPPDKFGFDVEEVPVEEVLVDEVATVTGSNSPPLEDLSLALLGDTSSAAPAEPPVLEHEIETIPIVETIETIQEQPAVEPIVPHEKTAAPAEPSSPVASAATENVEPGVTEPDVVEEPVAAEKSDSPEPVPESEKLLETPLDPSPEADAVVAHFVEPPVPSSPESVSVEDSPTEPEVSLNLSEPPPSEPIPPESESDITDEVHDMDEEAEVEVELVEENS